MTDFNRHGRDNRGSTSVEDGVTVVAPGKRSLVEQLTVQRRIRPGGLGPTTEDVQAAAAHGTHGRGGALPHLDQIQRSFGSHDVSHIKAHTDSAAREGAMAMGAQAFASGDHVAFAGTPDLHTTAHEAAHVVQQRGGVHLKGGVGAAGDAYERHADAVADRVVAGQSATDLLGPASIPHTPSLATQVQRKLLHEGKEVTDKQDALGLLQRKATEYGRQIDFSAHGVGVDHVMQSPEAYNLLDADNDPARHALSAIILAINKHSGVEPGHYQKSRSLDEIMSLIAADVDLVKVSEFHYTYRNGGTSKLESVLRGTDFEKFHTDGTSPKLFNNDILKNDDPESGLKVVTVGALRFLEREANDQPVDLKAIPTELQAKAKELNDKYHITESASWRSHRLDTERRGTVGEYLAQDDAARLMPLPKEGQPGGTQLQQWHSVHFIGDVYASETDATAKRSSTDAGPELDLMNVRKSEAGLHCLGVGNVKVGSTNMAGAANNQNSDALALLQSFSVDQRVRLSSGDWAHVKQITAVDIASSAAVPHIQRPFTIDGAVEKVTIGAKSAAGDYTQRLAHTAAEIMHIATCLKAFGAKEKGRK